MANQDKLKEQLQQKMKEAEKGKQDYANIKNLLDGEYLTMGQVEPAAIKDAIAAKEPVDNKRQPAFITQTPILSGQIQIKDEEDVNNTLVTEIIRNEQSIEEHNYKIFMSSDSLQEISLQKDSNG